MRRRAGLVLALLLVLGVVAAIVVSVTGGGAEDESAVVATPDELVVVLGVIGSEKEPFFDDPATVQAFAAHGYDVEVDTAGSRQIATSVDLEALDFAFPAGVSAAEEIRRNNPGFSSYEPFATPMAIATFRPIVDLLVGAGVATNEGDYALFDVAAYLELVANDTRWADLPGNTSYPASKSILVTSTDVRTSNSAALYVAIASYVANGNAVVQNAEQADRVLPGLSPLFLRQGYTETSSEGPFEDYLSVGIGKTPMVMLYEAQFLARAARNDGAITDEMVLMYPTPTVQSQHTLVPLSDNGDAVGRLLDTDPELLRLAVQYGFRTGDAAAFTAFADAAGITTPTLVDVVEPPTYANLEYLISAIEQQYEGTP